MSPHEVELINLLNKMALKTFPGLTMAIGKGDKIIWQHGAGYADAENKIKNKPEMIFGIGSITKIFVAVLILQLNEENYLTLDEPISTWLDKNVLADVANAENVTVRYLLSHYSGIPSWEDQHSWIHDARGKRVKPEKIWLPQENLDYIRGKKPLCAPGEAFHYSNSNFTLLGLLIEKLTYNSLEEELYKRIINPLLLKSTSLESVASLENQYSSKRFHRLDPHFIKKAGVSDCFKIEPNNILDVSAINLSVEWAAGGIVSTAQDVVNFILALRNGELLNPKSMKEMQQWMPADNAEMGLSLFRMDTDYGTAIGHGGNVLGASACVWWYEKTHCALAILTNVGSMHASPDAHCASTIFKNAEVGKLAQEICSYY